MNELTNGSKFQIKWLVDKFHVGTPDRQIIRDFYNRMKDKNYPKELRKNVYKYAIECHHANIDLYIWTIGSH